MLVSPLAIPVSLILAAGAVFCLTRVIREPSWVVRLNFSVHTLMALGMLGMVWHNVNVPLLPQLLLFCFASFWFVLQTVAHPKSNLGCHTRSGRLSCLYHAAMLAAMVFMLAVPHSAIHQGQSTATVEYRGHGSHGGHGESDVVASPPGIEFSALWIQPTVQVLAVLFAVAVLAWILPMYRLVTEGRGGKAPTVSRSSWHHRLVLERTNEAGSAMVMSLMFAAISLQS